MYFRRKTSAGRAYLQIVESRREGDQVRQQVIATLSRFEDLQAKARFPSRPYRLMRGCTPLSRPRGLNDVDPRGSRIYLPASTITTFKISISLYPGAGGLSIPLSAKPPDHGSAKLRLHHQSPGRDVR